MLSLTPTALYELAAPHTPPEVQAEVAAGERRRLSRDSKPLTDRREKSVHHSDRPSTHFQPPLSHVIYAQKIPLEINVMHKPVAYAPSAFASLEALLTRKLSYHAVPLPKLDVVAGKRPHQEFEGYFPARSSSRHAATPKEGMEEKEGQPITVLFEAVAVPSGDVRLMELQEKGWSYVRP